MSDEWSRRPHPDDPYQQPRQNPEQQSYPSPSYPGPQPYSGPPGSGRPGPNYSGYPGPSYSGSPYGEQGYSAQQPNPAQSYPTQPNPAQPYAGPPSPAGPGAYPGQGFPGPNPPQVYAYGGGPQYSPSNPQRPGVSMFEAGRLLFKNYAVFHGRASRSEYWWVQLWTLLALITITVLTGLSGGFAEEPSGLGLGVVALGGVAYLVGLVPLIALSVRRLHDANLSGFFILLNLIPSVGGLVTLVMTILPSQPAGIRFDHPDGRQPAAS